MPTTEPLDDVGDDAGGQLKPIAEFAAAQAQGAAVSGQAPRATVPTARTSVSAPAVASASRPAVTAPSASPRQFTNLRTPGISLSGRSAKTATTDRPDITPFAPQAEQSASYTDSDMSAAWGRFIETHAAEHLLVNAMRSATPTRVSGDKFRVSQSEVHIGIIRENIGRIRTEICRSLGNSHIDFDLDVVSEDSPLAWNDHELIRHIVEANPSVGEFIESLKLSLL